MLLAQANPIFETIQLWTAVVLLVFIALLGAAVIYAIFARKINISRLISEPNGDASMSRFQLLIFTFVIAVSFFLIVVGSGRFPDPIPQGVLVLLGISSSSYLVSKGIQFSSDAGLIEQDPAVVVSPPSVDVAYGTSQKFTVELIRLDATTVNWKSSPAGIGVLAAAADGLSATYTAPAAGAPQLVEITASSAANSTVFDVAVVHLA